MTKNDLKVAVLATIRVRVAFPDRSGKPEKERQEQRGAGRGRRQVSFFRSGVQLPDGRPEEWNRHERSRRDDRLPEKRPLGFTPIAEPSRKGRASFVTQSVTTPAGILLLQARRCCTGQNLREVRRMD